MCDEVVEKPDFERYLEASDASCPYCGSTNVVGGFVATNELSAEQNVPCEDCGEEWEDLYRLDALREADGCVHFANTPLRKMIQQLENDIGVIRAFGPSSVEDNVYILRKLLRLLEIADPELSKVAHYEALRKELKGGTP